MLSHFACGSISLVLLQHTGKFRNYSREKLCEWFLAGSPARVRRLAAVCQSRGLYEADRLSTGSYENNEEHGQRL